MSGRCLHNAQQRATAPPRRRPRQSLRLHFIPALRETRYVFSLCCQRTQARCLTDHTSARHNLGVAFPQLAHALHELDIDVAAHPSDLDRRWRPRAARPHPVRLLSQTPAAGKRICDLWPRVTHADAEPQELQLARLPVRRQHRNARVRTHFQPRRRGGHAGGRQLRVGGVAHEHCGLSGGECSWVIRTMTLTRISNYHESANDRRERPELRLRMFNLPCTFFLDYLHCGSTSVCSPGNHLPSYWHPTERLDKTQPSGYG